MLSIPALSIFIPLCQPSNQRTFHSKRFSGACDSNKMLWCSGSGVLVKTCQNQQPQFFHAGTIKTQCWFQRESIGAWHIFVLLVQFLFGPSILTGFLPRLTVNKASFLKQWQGFDNNWQIILQIFLHIFQFIISFRRKNGEIWEKSGTAWSCSWVMGRFTFRRSSKRLKRHGFALGFPWGFPWGCSHCFHNVITVYQQCITTEYHQKLPWENYLEYLKQPLLKSKSRLTRGCSENVDLRQAPLAIPNAAMPCIRKIKAVTRDTFSKTFSDGFFLHVTP